MGEFGDKFRKAREKKNLSLDDVSNVTKIGARMLQAIEEEKFDQLPGGVFNKGFIRAYAKHLGINDEEAVTEYLACLRQAQIEAQAVWEPPARMPAPAKRPVAQAARQETRTHETKTPTSTQVEELPELQLPRAEDVRPLRRPGFHNGDNGIPWRLVAAGLVVVVLGIVLWRRHSQNSADESSGARETVQAAQAPSSEPAAASQPPATQVATGVPANTSIDRAHPPASKATPSGMSSGNASTPSPSPSAAEHQAVASSTKTPTDTAENDVTTRSFPAAEPAAKAKALSLVIRASENSWIAVTADGQAVSQETLIAPANTAVHANREIVAKVGNSAGVSFVWNGKEIPAEGAESEVKTFIFDAQGMRVIPANQAPGQNR